MGRRFCHSGDKVWSYGQRGLVCGQIILTAEARGTKFRMPDECVALVKGAKVAEGGEKG